MSNDSLRLDELGPINMPEYSVVRKAALHVADSSRTIQECDELLNILGIREILDEGRREACALQVDTW